MATALDLCTTALKEIGVLAAGETATAEDAADAFASLNRMASQFNAEKLLLFAQLRTTWTLTASPIPNTYTVGTGGTINTPRPVYVEDVKFQDTAPTFRTEYPLSEFTEAAYAGVTLKTMTSPFPQAWFYNPTYPLGTLTLWPAPTSSTLQGVMYSGQVISQFAALTTVVSLPDGYEEMIVTNLAMRLAAPYSRTPDPSLVERARDSKAIAKRSNVQLRDLSFGYGSGHGNWSIYTGP